jgi:hypothetical protein
MYGGELLGVAVGLVDGDEHLVHLVDGLVHPSLERRMEGEGGGHTRWVPVAMRVTSRTPHMQPGHSKQVC